MESNFAVLHVPCEGFFFFLLLQAGIGSGVKSNLSYPFHGSELG